MGEHDPIIEIDMQDSANFAKAIELALNASDESAWSEMPKKWCDDLGKDAEVLFTVRQDSGSATDPGPLISAITSNGPKSAANAEFYASARKIVLGLVSEVDRLRTIIRVQRADAAGAP